MPFPWLTVRWPRSLPVLPEHQDPALLEPWDAASTRPYIQEKISTTSIFEGRQANAEIEAESFLDYFVHAAKLLAGIRLTGQALTRIALQFAVDSSRRRALPQPSITDFMDAVPEIQALNPTMDFRFRCGECMHNCDQKASARHIKHNIPLATLFLHWSKCHDDDGSASDGREDAEIPLDGGHHWTLGFMHLPSDSELYELVMESDKTLEKEKEVIRAAAAGGNARKKPKAKAGVILGTPAATEAFGKLFPIA